MGEMKKTYCRICEAACGLIVDCDEAGTPVKIRPDRDHPTSQGYACAKGTQFLSVAQHRDRLTQPMRRGVDGRLAPVAWDDAIMDAGAKIRAIVDKHGPHAVGIYFGNPLAFNSRGTLALLGFMRALGTRNVYSAGSQDCNNKFAGSQIVHGSPVIQPIPDFERADLAVLFGTNPTVSQSSFVHLEGGARLFDKMRARGAEIVWVDPRRTESIERGGTHLVIRPGTDIWLMLALLNLLRDKYAPGADIEGLDRMLDLAKGYTPERAAELTGIPAEQIRGLADKISASSKTAFHMSVGVNQGGYGTFAYVALHALIVLTGNMDKEGGTLIHPLAVLAGDLTKRAGYDDAIQYSRIGNYPSTLGTLPGGILADEILTPGDEQIRAMIVVAGDPLRSMPGSVRLRQAFRSLDFCMTVDMFENTTGREAHLLLPATSWLERWDIATTTSLLQHTSLLQYGDAVTPPPGEARAEADILADLARAIGGKTARRARLPMMATSAPVDKLMRWGAPLIGKVGSIFGAKGNGYGVNIPAPKPGTYLGKGPRTPGHKMRFWDTELDRDVARMKADEEGASRSAPTEDANAFVLTGRRRRLGHNGWLHGGARDGEAESAAWLSAEELDRLGLRGGGHIRIESAASSLVIYAKPQDGIAPRTVVVPHGLPDANSNDLIPSGEGTFEYMSGQHRMTGIPVRVSAA